MISHKAKLKHGKNIQTDLQKYGPDKGGLWYLAGQPKGKIY